MINVWQRWKRLLPDLIWNAVPVCLNLADLVTYSLVLSDTLLYGLKVCSIASCSYLCSPMCNFWHFHGTHTHIHKHSHTRGCIRCSTLGLLGYGGVDVLLVFFKKKNKKNRERFRKQIQAEAAVGIV